jgi:hypothetical protein
MKGVSLCCFASAQKLDLANNWTYSFCSKNGG